jgi:hypothetical protein
VGAALMCLVAVLVAACVVSCLAIAVFFHVVDGPDTDERDPFGCCGAPSDGRHELSCEQLTAADFADELGLARAAGVDHTPTGAHERDAALTDVQREEQVEQLWAALSDAPRELPIVAPGRAPRGIAIYPQHVHGRPEKK